MKKTKTTKLSSTLVSHRLSENLKIPRNGQKIYCEILSIAIIWTQADGEPRDTGEFSDEEISDDEPEEVLPNVSHSQAEQYIKLLRHYSEEKQPELLRNVMSLESQFQSFWIDRQLSGKQSKMEDFFGK